MRSLLVAGLTLAATAAGMENYFRMPPPYSYSCVDSQCIRGNRVQSDTYMSLDGCTLTCGQYGSLWPKPSKKVQLSKDLVSFHPENVKFTKIGVTTKMVEDMMDEASHYFMRKLHFKHPEYPSTGKGPFTDYESMEKRENRFDTQKQNEFYDKFDKSSQNYENMMRYESISPFTKEGSSSVSQNHMVNIDITVTSDDSELHLDTDESYDIVAQTVGDTTTVTILANTYYGARHALESLSQLMAYDEMNNSLMMLKSAQISDEPAFEYRGIMLDTGRNFYPKQDIMKLMDTMSSNKLNTFHWHIADSASFPMYSHRQPQMTYVGAYSPSKVYYPEDIREIVKYANIRGIRVVPELSAPGHTGAGWTFGEDAGKGKLVLCTDEDRPWFENCNEPPCGQLNPTNPEVYNVLKEVYSDMIDAFDPELFHMGGDDVSFKCWKNSPEITTYFSENNKEATSAELFELWNTFQETAYSKMFEATERRDKPVIPMIYSSSFVRQHIDHNKYIVQLTNEVNDTEIEAYLRNNFKVIFSNSDTWNFEGPANSWVGSQATTYSNVPAPSWKEVYENSPLDMLSGLGVTNARSAIPTSDAETLPRDLVLGGEATIWSYGTDPASLQTTAWPRASAMAERLWSDPKNNDQGNFQAEEVQHRLAAHRERMVSEGTQAEVFQPEYCFRNQNSCYSQAEYEFRTEIVPAEK
ncbi:unnamed protein product [Meganyctiphanes norvegica]|uniref:beta-N-acetylhexosaminidase n=1 Tax=Meganyctiphanes norvegica TaxID=48144 RepID=A0AAV2RXA2_MEGNR